jgi:hypothetical protein
MLGRWEKEGSREEIGTTVDGNESGVIILVIL